MDIIWLSANRLGYELLKEAVKLKEVNIRAIITLNDKSRTIMYDGIKKEKWHEFGKEVIEIGQINEEEVIKKLSPDLVVMCGWRQVIDKKILDIPKNGFIGFHPTLLPKGRGPAPIINTILSGFRESGITMFYVSDQLDEGDVIGQEKFPVGNDDYAEDVYEKSIDAGKKLVKKYLPLIIKDTAPRIKQNNSKALIFDKPKLEDNEIDFENEPIERIYKKIRALSKPYKGAYLIKDGKKLIIWKAELQDLK